MAHSLPNRNSDTIPSSVEERALLVSWGHAGLARSRLGHGEVFANGAAIDDVSRATRARFMNPEQALEELELEPDATPEQIQKAHRERARECHPDADGDVASMQRLNQARDVALASTGALNAATAQELVLRRILDLESRRDEREIAQQKGSELVAAAARIRVGRLRGLQRRASTITLLSGAMAAMLALLRTTAGPWSSPALNALLTILGVLAIGFGIYRIVLAEMINRVQLAIEDVGSDLANRSVFAKSFRAVAEGLLNMGSFDEQDLERAVRVWMRHGAEKSRILWLGLSDQSRLIASLDDLESFDETGLPKKDADTHPHHLFVRLADIVMWGRAVGMAEVDERLTALALAGALDCYRTEKGICIPVEDVLRLGDPDGLGRPLSANQFMDAIGSILSNWRMLQRTVPAQRKLLPAASSPRRLRRSMERIGLLSRDDASIERKLEALARRIGTVDFVKLLIGKGLENRLLSEREVLDSHGELMVTYRFEFRADKDEGSGSV